jgi:hypothetical protein
VKQKTHNIYHKIPKMDKETLRMQMLAGVITESEYAAAINQEVENTEKDSLNEHMIGGIVGIGAINQIPSRAKADYEDAFEYFLSQKYSINEEMESDNEIKAFLDDMINTSIPEDSEEGEEINGVWEAEEYADEDAYGEAAQEFKNAHEYIMGKGGETTIEGNPDVTYKALPNGDIAYSLIATLGEGKKGKMYFHVLEDGGYGEIGHQGVYDTKEEAQNRADSLSDMFPDSSFYVEASDSEDEPYSVTMEEGKEVEEPNNY